MVADVAFNAWFSAVPSVTLLLVGIAAILLAVIVIVSMTTSSTTTDAATRATIKQLPGPTGMAAIGLLLGMRKGAPRSLFNEAMQYGKSFGIGKGDGTLCVIMDYNDLEEAFVNKAESFADRGGILEDLMSSIPLRGSIMNNGPAWHEIREFVAQTVKNADYGRENIDRCAHASIPSLKAAIDNENDDEPFDPKFIYQRFVFDVLHRIGFGIKIDYGDDAVKRFAETLDDVVVQTLNPSLSVLVFPFIAKGCLYTGYRNKLQSSARYIESLAEETFLRRDAVDASSSLVAKFARYIEAIRSAGKATLAEPDDGWRLIFDFFFAASDTVHEVLLWATLFLASSSDVQDRMRSEIRQLTDTTAADISYEDRSRLPFSLSVMLEVLRMRPVAPLGVPHYASQDDTVDDCGIGKGTQMFPNLWGMHHDPDVWENQDEFNPSRFLNDQFEVDEEKAKLVIPFSIGLRSCPGEQIARRTIFKALVDLVSAYRISLPVVGHQPRLVDEEHSFTMVPDRFKVVFSKL